MKREQLGAPVVVGDVTITPVERISLEEQKVGPFVLWTGAKEPIAVIVRLGEREWRLELPRST